MASTFWKTLLRPQPRFTAMCSCGRSVLLWCCLMGGVCGCAATSQSAAARAQVKPALRQVEPILSDDVTGVWHGRTIANCAMITTYNPGRCSAMQLITLTMFQSGGQVTGSYKCAFGNEECR